MNKINLYKFSSDVRNKVLTKEQANELRNFIQTKINNGTLYTPDKMINYPLSKRLQLFVNSNIAEHAIVDILGGQLLEGNDELTIESTAVIGEDGCALADTTINNIEVEVKVTYNDETKKEVLKKAHKKPVVAVYIISPTNKHWEFYVRQDKHHLDQLVTLWQNKMLVECPKLPLLYFKDLEDGRLEVSTMMQK